MDNIEDSENNTEIAENPFKWYAVLTQSGMENKAKQALEERIKKFKLIDFFEQVLIPTQQVDYIDEQGKRKTRQAKIMPGYILIHMIMSDKSFICVRETPKISNFVGVSMNKMPQPMNDIEVEQMFSRSTQVSKNTVIQTKLSFEKGERVKVIDGPFTGFVGDIDEVKQEKQKLRLLISVFGRPTPVELEFSKVEKEKV